MRETARDWIWGYCEKYQQWEVWMCKLTGKDSIDIPIADQAVVSMPFQGAETDMW